jgi:hypothetical protein
VLTKFSDEEDSYARRLVDGEEALMLLVAEDISRKVGQWNGSLREVRWKMESRRQRDVC